MAIARKVTLCVMARFREIFEPCRESVPPQLEMEKAFVR